MVDADTFIPDANKSFTNVILEFRLTFCARAHSSLGVICVVPRFYLFILLLFHGSFSCLDSEGIVELPGSSHGITRSRVYASLLATHGALICK